jgi:NADH:ubiquinone reductase (H+-translocating)
MGYKLNRDVRAGIAAGFAAALLLHGMETWDALRAGAGGTGGWAVIGTLAGDLASGAAGGAAFAAVFRYQPGSPAFSASGGLLFGLLWWIVGPLTAAPVLGGHLPTWSVREAGDAFPGLIGHVLYGALLGIGFYTLASLRRPAASISEAAGARSRRPSSHVVILGGGFAGVNAAQHLEELLRRRRDVHVALISQSNYLLFTPLLAEVAAGELEAQHIGVPLRAALPHTDVRRAEVTAIDTRERVIWIRSGPAGPLEAVPYDQLVLALGSVPDYRSLPGLAAHAFAFKTLDDAVRLRNHIIGSLERADAESDPAERRRLLTFVVAGAGFAGTEVIIQLCDFVRNVRRFYQRVRPQDLRFLLVHSGPRILPELDGALAAYAHGKLSARGVEVRLNTRVDSLTADTVMLAGGNPVPARTLVWTAGNRPHPAVRALRCDHNAAGAVVDEITLRVKGLDAVWAVGDCAQVPDLSNGSAPCPPTAQHAVRQGAAVAENVARSLTGRPARPFRFRTQATLVGLGRRSAVADWRGRRMSGLLAWFMWRTVYLGKLPGLDKKIRVAADWTLDLFFPRDIMVTPAADEGRAGSRADSEHSAPPPGVLAYAAKERGRR